MQKKRCKFFSESDNAAKCSEIREGGTGLASAITEEFLGKREASKCESEVPIRRLLSRSAKKLYEGDSNAHHMLHWAANNSLDNQGSSKRTGIKALERDLSNEVLDKTRPSCGGIPLSPSNDRGNHRIGSAVDSISSKPPSDEAEASPAIFPIRTVKRRGKAYGETKDYGVQESKVGVKGSRGSSRSRRTIGEGDQACDDHSVCSLLGEAEAHEVVATTSGGSKRITGGTKSESVFASQETELDQPSSGHNRVVRGRRRVAVLAEGPSSRKTAKGAEASPARYPRRQGKKDTAKVTAESQCLSSSLDSFGSIRGRRRIQARESESSEPPDEPNNKTLRKSQTKVTHARMSCEESNEVTDSSALGPILSTSPKRLIKNPEAHTPTLRKRTLDVRPRIMFTGLVDEKAEKVGTKNTD